MSLTKRRPKGAACEAQPVAETDHDEGQAELLASAAQPPLPRPPPPEKPIVFMKAMVGSWGEGRRVTHAGGEMAARTGTQTHCLAVLSLENNQLAHICCPYTHIYTHTHTFLS